MKYLSLCIPTNGITEWVFPVLSAIYRQNVSLEEYEVVVTDNGKDNEFYNEMLRWEAQYPNLIYKRTEAFLFENQIEALRLATGEYLKFMNHRSILEPGALQWMINFVKKYRYEKPVIYLSNGALKLSGTKECKNFDDFVKGIEHYASWTTGVGVWRSDFRRIPENHIYNKISPHSDVLFAERNRDKYVIDDTIWSHDIDSSHVKKGKYDLYKAFAVEEISITLQLFLDGDISAKTLKYVIKRYERCVAEFYALFNILKTPCSYILEGFDDAMGIFVSRREVLLKAYIFSIKLWLAQIINMVRKKSS